MKQKAELPIRVWVFDDEEDFDWETQFPGILGRAWDWLIGQPSGRGCEKRTPGISVAQAFGTPQEFIDEISGVSAEDFPEIFLIDMRYKRPDGTEDPRAGLQCIEALYERADLLGIRPDPPCLVFTVYDRDLETDIAIRAGRAFPIVDKRHFSRLLSPQSWSLAGESSMANLCRNLIAALHRAIEREKLKNLPSVSTAGPAERFLTIYKKVFHEHVPRNPRFLEVLSQAEIFAATLCPEDPYRSIVVCGETGTGKTRLCEVMHQSSPIADRPFVKLSLRSLNLNLWQSELQGHRRGAYTDAREDSEGLYSAAADGVLLLEDIDKAPLALQAALLSVFEEREYRRQGETKVRSFDARLMATCCEKQELMEMIKRKRFLRDFWERISVCEVHRLPLREDEEEILAAAERFAAAMNVGLSNDARKALVKHHWPGNYRQLHSAIEAGYILAVHGGRKLITFADMKAKLSDRPLRVDPIAEAERATSQLSHQRSKDVMKAVRLRRELDDAEGNVSAAARRLKISRATAYNLVKKYDALRKQLHQEGGPELPDLAWPKRDEEED